MQATRLALHTDFGEELICRNNTVRRCNGGARLCAGDLCALQPL